MGICQLDIYRRQMNKDWKSHLKKIGSLGGTSTYKKYGRKHYQKMVDIREKNKTQKLSTIKSKMA